MATVIKPKRSSVGGKLPKGENLEVGEIALNLTDKKLYTKQADGTVIAVSDHTEGGYALDDLSNVGSLPTSVANDLKGQKGQKGQIGAQGDQGLTGEKGNTGSQGLQGNAGTNGAKGQKGEAGLNGSNGLDGNKGQKGQTGSTGNTGTKGQKGQAGVNGTDGDKGQKGQKGDNSEITGNNQRAVFKTGADTAEAKDIIYANSTYNTLTINGGVNVPLIIRNETEGGNARIQYTVSDSDTTQNYSLGVQSDADFTLYNATTALTPLRVKDTAPNAAVIVAGDTDAAEIGIGGNPSATLHGFSSNPSIRLTDTDTNADFQISASSGVGGAQIHADISSEGSNPYLDLSVAGHNYIRSLGEKVGLHMDGAGISYDLEVRSADNSPNLGLRTTSTDQPCTLYFGDSGSTTAGAIEYQHAHDDLVLRADGSEIMRLHGPEQRVSINSTNADKALVVNGETAADSEIVINTPDAGTASTLRFRDAGSTNGYLSSNDTQITVASSDGAVKLLNGNNNGLYFQNYDFRPLSTDAGLINLGTSDYPFNNLWLDDYAYVDGIRPSEQSDGSLSLYFDWDNDRTYSISDRLSGRGPSTSVTTSSGQISVLSSFVPNHSLEDNGGWLDYQDKNIIGGAIDRGYTVTATKAGSTTTAQADWFKDPGSSGGNHVMANSTDEFVITVEGFSEALYSTFVGVAFGSHEFRAKYVKIEAYGGTGTDSWRTVLEVSDNKETVVASAVANNDGAGDGTTKLRYTFKDPHNTGGMYFRINQLFMLNYQTKHSVDGNYINRYGDQTLYGDLNFGDNDKAVFGAGSDLQIFHNGSHSYVTDIGTGDLKLYGANVEIGNTSGFKNFLGRSGGASSVYYNNAEKLATTSTGIDVTGTVTADGLDASTGDITTTSIGFNNSRTTTPDGLSYPIIWRSASAHLDFNGGDLVIQARSDADRDIHFVTGNTPTKRMNIDGQTGDISFYEDTGTTPKFFWDSSTERLGIGNAAPTTALDVTGTVSADGLNLDGNIQGDTGQNMQVSAGAGTGDKLDLRAGDDVRIYVNGASAHKLAANFTNNGDVSLYEDTGTTAKFHWDASTERLGIGTSNPSDELHLARANDPRLRIDATATGVASNLLLVNSADNLYAQIENDGSELVFKTQATERMRINSSGNVGIGGSTPSEKLEVSNGSAADSGEISIKLGGDIDNNARTMTITKDTSTPYNTIINTQNNTGVNTGSLIFKNGATEQMRIDSSGNVLVGKTSVNQFTTVGHELHEDGLVVSTRDSGNVAVLNRETNDGSIIQFRKDNSTVGTISAATTNIIYGNNTRGIKIEDALIIPRNVNDTNADDQVDLGSSTSRWKDLHLSGTAYSDKIQINNTTQLDTTAALEVNNAEGSGYARITLNDTDGNNQRTYFEQSNGLTRISTQNGSNYGDFVISAWNGSQTRNSLYVDNVNHKIGLGGDTTPEKHLTVNFNSTETDVFASGLPGGASGQGVLIRNENTTGSTYANLDFRAGTVDARIATQYSGSSNQGKMLFIMDKDGSAPATMLTLNADGGVAIGGSEADHGYQACIHGNLWVKSADGTHNAISIGELADNSNSPLYQIGTDDDNGDELRIETARWGHRTSWYRGSPSGPDIESIRLSSTADGTDSGSMLSLYRQDDYSTSTAVSNLIHLSTMGNSYINSGHNVGIGTSSPSDKLDVHGTIYARGGTFQGATSDAPTDTAMVIDVNNAIMFSTGTNVRNLIRNGASDSTIIEVGQNFTSLIDNIDLIPGSSGNVRFKTSNGDTKAYVNSGGDVVATRHQIAKNQAGTYVFDDTITANTQEDIFSVQCTRGAMAMTVYMVCNTNNMSVAKTYQVVKASGSAPVVTLIADTGAFGSHDFEATFSQGVNDTTMVCEIDNDSTTINAEITTTVVMGGSPTTITVTEL